MSERDQRHAGSSRRVVVAVLVLALLLGAAGGVLWWRSDSGWLPGRSEPVASALDVAAPDGLELPDARVAREVLAQPDGAAVSVPELRRRLRPLLQAPRFGKRIGVAVHDLTHDVRLLEVGGGTYMPASTLKLVTAAAALQLLGPRHRFETSVTLSDERRPVPTVTLVGGGDPMLSARADQGAYPRRATLRELVDQTARALRRAGTSRVRVGVDDTLFTGPAVAPTWEPSYVPDVTTPVSALWVDEGIDPSTSVRSTEPAALAARTFAAALRARGVRVAAVAAEPAAGPVGARELASVTSPPLQQVVEHVLGASDNEGAEVLLRHVGLAGGRAGSFAGGAAAARAALVPLGVPWTRVRMADGSGLSRRDRLPLETVLAVLRLGADDSLPDLRAVVSGLPVAGFDGTLASRFFAPGTGPALGLVRAKTGTLTGTHALAGTVVDADGVQLAFIAVANGVAVRNTLFARDQLDRITAVLAACGCGR